ncbi:hypothetical protein EDD18DRAFT_1138263 [Armillaria luteobubalina]|uniref:Uncharacterized protein n=1 Tax=Armillaria luteobubalina TaxID=153913 RepID=A0AA39UU95_9AGAR|nr:hypothetical protein EDD18DRAFT_1138263 [Armillaria luteobubalina]
MSPLQYHRNGSGPRQSTPPQSHSRRVLTIWKWPLLYPVYESPLSPRRQKVLFDFEDSFRVPVRREEDDEDNDSVSFPGEDEESLIAELSHDGWPYRTRRQQNSFDSLEHSFTRYHQISSLTTTLRSSFSCSQTHQGNSTSSNTRVDDDFRKGPGVP